MKRYLLFLLLVLTVVVSAGTTAAIAAPLTEDGEVKAETYDLDPLRAPAMLRVGEECFQGTMQSDVLLSDFEFMAVGVTWADALPDNVTTLLSLRVSSDAGQTWGDWQALTQSDHGRDDMPALATELHFATGNAVQLQVTVQSADNAAFVWEGVRVTVIDGTAGPTALELAEQRAEDEAAGMPPTVISRAGWGANESYRFDSSGNEIWERDYYGLRAMFVHHTATAPNYDNPAAAVRSIYYYHAITQGWGDIGYHYVIDQYGNVYQGRYGTEVNGLVVEGGHALGYNRNTMGVSLIGDFTNTGATLAQTNSLKSFLADRAGTYGIDPFASVYLDGVGTTSPDRTFPDSVLGHRDSHTPARTTCPGDVLYARLNEIRQYVADNSSEIVDVNLVSPPDNSTLDGEVTVRSDATPNVTRVSYYLDNSYIGSATAPPWAITVDSGTLPAGDYTLEARATSAAGTTADDDHTVTVAEFFDTPDSATTSSAVMTDTLHALFLPMVLAPPPPPICQELVPNHDFSKNTGWIMLLSEYAARYDNTVAYASTRSLRVGMAPNDNFAGFSSARVPLTIPADADTVVLTMQYLPKAGANHGADGQYIGILNASGVYAQSITPYGQVDNFDDWAALTFDLSDYKGESIYLYVGTKNDGSGGATTLYADDVSVQSCIVPE